MLNTAVPPKRSIFDRLEVGNGKDGNGVSNDGVEIVKKSEKSKDQKSSKSQKSAKSRKNLSKCRNLPNYNAKDNRLSFLTPKAKAAFNYIQLTFTKALIL